MLLTLLAYRTRCLQRPAFSCLHLHGSALPSFAMLPLLPAPVLGAQFREQRAPSRDQ